MTNAELLAKIKAEIERRIAPYSLLSENTVNPNRIDEDRQLLSFLSTLETEKPMQEGLEEEISKKYANDTTTMRTREQYAELARYFYDLGCRRTAEKYDEIEYNRQRTEESEKPMNQEELEKEINRFREIFRDECDARIVGEIANHFAKWGAEHLKK